MRKSFRRLKQILAMLMLFVMVILLPAETLATSSLGIISEVECATPLNASKEEVAQDGVISESTEIPEVEPATPQNASKEESVQDSVISESTEIPEVEPATPQNASKQEADVSKTEESGKQGPGMVQMSLKKMIDDEGVDEDLCYFVDAGDVDPSTLGEGDQFGIYNSVTEQYYGEDPETGKKWGLVDEDAKSSQSEALKSKEWLVGKQTWPCENQSFTDETDSAKTYRYTKNQKRGGYGIPYKFELPNGTYKVKVTMATAWSNQVSRGDSYDVIVNKGKGTECSVKNVKTTYITDAPAVAEVTAEVEDGCLTLDIGMSASNEKTICAVVNQIYIWKVEPEEAEITDVTISPTAISVSRGNTYTFTAEVQGTGNYDDSVDWSVEDAKSDETSISEGKLKIADDETAETLTVTATSVEDDSVYAEAEVTVLQYHFQEEEVFIDLERDDCTAILTLEGNLDGEEISWSSSKPDIVGFVGEPSGVSVQVEGKNRGLSVVSATINGSETIKCVVAVVNEDVDPALYYFVNAGDIDPTTRNNDFLGICNGVTDQFYAEDETTGMKWGVDDQASVSSNYPNLLTGKATWPCENNGYTDETDSSITYRYTKDQPAISDGGIGLPYRFELPEGRYIISLNMATGWPRQASYRYDVYVNKGTDTEQHKNVPASISSSNPTKVEFITDVGESQELVLNINQAAGSKCAVVNQIYIRRYDGLPRLENNRVSLSLGESYQIEVLDADNVEVTNWQSSDSEVVFVDDGGQLLAKAAGTATITAMAGSKLLKAYVTVTIDSEIVIDYENTDGEIHHVAGGNLHMFDDRSPAGWLSDGVGIVAVRGQDHSKGSNNDYEYLPGFFEDGTYNRLQAMNEDVKLMIGVYYGYKGKAGRAWKDAAIEGSEQNALFKSHIQGVLAEAEEKGIEVYSWIPMNEPDLQWSGNEWTAQKPQNFFKVAYNEIKRINPAAKVQGPEMAGTQSLEKLKNFLLFCKENNCLPDILSWHDLKNYRPSIEEDLKTLNAWMKENGIDPMPVAVTEYQGMGYKTDEAGRKSDGNYNTGLTTAYLANMERAEKSGLIAGLRSEWGLPGSNANARGDMGEMCDFETKQMATGLWYVYNAYWDMTGDKLQVNHDSHKLEVLATVDTAETKKQSAILIGNWKEESAYPQVRLENIPDSLIRDGKVHVRIEGLNETLATPCYSTTKLMNQEIEVNADGSLVLYPVIDGRQSCYLILTPPVESVETVKAVDMEAVITGNMQRTDKTVVDGAYVSFSGGVSSSYRDENGAETYVETGDSVSWKMFAWEDGVYNLTSTFVTGRDAGFMALYVDGKQFGFPIDLYATDTKELEFNHGNLYLAEGEHEFMFRIVGHGKNSQSSGMTLNFLEFSLGGIDVGSNPGQVPQVTAVEISPKTAVLKQGESLSFTAEITGTGEYGSDVSWSISGSDSTNTKISANGLLQVALDECAESITIIAQSVFDNTKQASAVVTIEEARQEQVKTYSLIVENGSGSGNYEENQRIAIQATAPEQGMRFVNWKIVSGAGSFEDTGEEITEFVMGSQDTRIKAIYEKKQTVSNSSGNRIYTSSTSLAKRREEATSEGRWTVAGSDWKFVKKDGTAATGWQRLYYNGKLEWYYFLENGNMHTGWFQDKDGEYYYLWMQSDGTKGRMLTGWQMIDGKWYYFNPISNGKRGALYRNCMTPDGYRVDEKGVWLP